MGSQLSGFGNGLYDSKQREFLGRDGAGWTKLGIFYSFFYLGVAGFFCTMLAILSSFTPRDHPRYHSESSCMQSRSNPLSPGLGFRPQPDVGKNLIFVDKNTDNYQADPYFRSLTQYLGVYYPNYDGYPTEINRFLIQNSGSCIPENQYGISIGKPCVLIKMNKIVGFRPVPGHRSEDKIAYQAAGCQSVSNAIDVHCYGENPADADNIGNITYISENRHDDKCGSLETKWFPYTGKKERRDVYQAPYIWVQFNNPTPNVLINVICRAYAENIIFDRKKSRNPTLFKIYIKDLNHTSSNTNKEI